MVQAEQGTGALVQPDRAEPAGDRAANPSGCLRQQRLQEVAEPPG